MVKLRVVHNHNEISQLLVFFHAGSFFWTKNGFSLFLAE